MKPYSYPLQCEQDNSKTRELQVCQSLALQLRVGLWSGNKRKMELAESSSQPLITMLRRAGRLRRKPPPLGPEPGDDDRTLEAKWRDWIEAESYKRLALYVMVYDSQASISLLTRPLISYAELSLELPYTVSLWKAKNAHEWRDIYLNILPGISSRLPSVMHSVRDVQLLSKVKNCIDLQFSSLVILYAMWSLISEYRLHQFVLNSQGSERQSNGALISSSWQQELVSLLDHFSLTISDFKCGMSGEACLLQELFLMNLYVNFEEIQLFAGKEGSEEAQAVYPSLIQWFDSRRSRQAAFHAGQILRAATTFPSGCLRDFYAVALYHAALCFWVYGVCSMGANRTKFIPGMQENIENLEEDGVVWLDCDETTATKRFIAIGRGTPMVSCKSKRTGENLDCRLDNPKDMMQTIITIMNNNYHDGSVVVQPLVENLGQLMTDLGNAAWSVKSQGLRGNM